MSSYDPYDPYGEQQPPPQPQPYQYPPQFGPPVPPTNGMAIASLVLGIASPFFCGVASVLALVFGYMAKSQIRQRGEGGSGMATAGIVLGWIGVAASVLLTIVLVIGFLASY